MLYVGRFVREKGIHVLLNAASAVLAEEPNTKFLIVGGGHRERLEKFVHWAGLQEKVLFTGFLANRALHSLYRCADVSVFPLPCTNRLGSWPWEAMAAGSPVVASDAGGLREVVRNDETGTLSYAGDPGSLAWVILRVLRDPARAAKLRASAPKCDWKVDFDWGRIAEQTIQIYDRCWNEFLDSYWASDTLWPVTPGAEERAEASQVKTKAASGVGLALERPSETIFGKAGRVFA